MVRIANRIARQTDAVRLLKLTLTIEGQVIPNSHNPMLGPIYHRLQQDVHAVMRQAETGNLWEGCVEPIKSAHTVGR